MSRNLRRKTFAITECSVSLKTRLSAADDEHAHLRRSRRSIPRYPVGAFALATDRANYPRGCKRCAEPKRKVPECAIKPRGTRRAEYTAASKVESFFYKVRSYVPNVGNFTAAISLLGLVPTRRRPPLPARPLALHERSTNLPPPPSLTIYRCTLSSALFSAFRFPFASTHADKGLSGCP